MKLTNVEPLLASSTVVAVSMIPLLGTGSSTETIVLTAIIVTLLQGLLLAALRARRQKDRAECVLEVRQMLQDQVKGQLSRITMAATAGPEVAEDPGRLQSEVLGAVDSVTLMVDGLSPESMRSWRTRYTKAHDHAMARRSTEMAGV